MWEYIKELMPKGECIIYDNVDIKAETYTYVLNQIRNVYMKEYNSDLVEVSPSRFCCPECAKYQGRIYSLTGMDSRFPLFPDWLSKTKCAHCEIDIDPFLYGVDTPSFEGDIFEVSNRPFIDNRPQSEIDEYSQTIALFEEDQQDRALYAMLVEKCPEIAPKSYGSFRRMKSQKTKGYIKLAEEAKLCDIELPMNGSVAKKISPVVDSKNKNIFPCPTQEEFDYISERLNYIKQNYSKEHQSIALAYEAWMTVHRSHHILNQIVIQKYKESDDSIDILAVAMAYCTEPVKYRKLAIQYFERYFTNPVNLTDLPKDPAAEIQCCTMFSDWFLHLKLAELYEKEYMYDEAIEQIKLRIKCVNGTNPADYIAIGDILIKIDLYKAKDYYENLMKSEVYAQHQYSIDWHYNDVLNKINMRYVFTPRKSKKSNSLTEEEAAIIEAAKVFI